MRARSLAVATGLMLVFGEPIAAHAYQSMTTRAVNVRLGAGVNFGRVATLPSGASVWVDFCQHNWCAVSTPTTKGWVSARYLRGEAGTPPPLTPYQPPLMQVPPAVAPNLVVPRGHFHDTPYSNVHKLSRDYHLHTSR